MKYSEGQLLSFTPFVFKNGAFPKKKYYIVLKHIFFLPNQPVTPIFHFPLTTFVYGEQVDEYAQNYLDEMDTEIEDLGVIHHALFVQLKECLKQSTLLKRKYRKLL